MFRFKKLLYKLLVSSLLIALVPLIILSVINTDQASRAISELAYSKLESVRAIKTRQISDYFNVLDSSLALTTSDSTVLQATTEFTAAFNSAAGVQSTGWREAETAYGSRLQAISETNNWYDLFLIDLDGNIVYTVAKESDLGASLSSGTLAQSNFGRLFRTASTAADSSVHVVDFAPYAPSGNEPAGFMMTAVADNAGQKVGYIALQVPIDQINNIMNQRDGMGETGEVYLVGPDKRLRSNSFLDPVNRSVKQSFAGNVANNGVDTEASRRALAGQQGVDLIIDYNGNPVLSAYAPLIYKTLSWAIIAEIDEAEALAARADLLRTAIILFLLATALVIVLGYLVSMSVSKPIQAIAETSGKVAEGDLSVSVTVDQLDEVGSLQQSMRAMVQKLHAMVTHISSSSEQQASAAEELAAITQQTRDTVSNQTAATEQVATAITEMSASITEVSGNTSRSAERARDVDAQMQQSATEVERTVKDVKELEDKITTTMSEIQALEKGAQDISGILDVIKGIADQTNLLALNAAIEAARAGEQGRGFAVVADEVRSLAQNTQNSAGEIEAMIKKLQSDALNSVSSMQVGADKTSEIAAQFTEIAQNLYHSAEGVREISDMSTQIATAAEQQSAVADEISSKANQISELSIETGESAEQISIASNELARLAEDLSLQVGSFKLE